MAHRMNRKNRIEKILDDGGIIAMQSRKSRHGWRMSLKGDGFCCLLGSGARISGLLYQESMFLDNLQFQSKIQSSAELTGNLRSGL